MYYPNCYKIDMILIIDIIHHKTATHSLIAVNHHQPKPRMPPFLAKPSHIWPLHLEALPGMEPSKAASPTSRSASYVAESPNVFGTIFISLGKKKNKKFSKFQNQNCNKINIIRFQWRRSANSVYGVVR